MSSNKDPLQDEPSEEASTERTVSEVIRAPVLRDTLNRLLDDDSDGVETGDAYPGVTLSDISDSTQDGNSPVEDGQCKTVREIFTPLLLALEEPELGHTVS